MAAPKTKARATKAVAALTDMVIEEPVGQWAALLTEADLIKPYQVTASITIAVPDPERAQEIRNADMALSLLRLKLAELLLDKGREPGEAAALDAVRDKLSGNPGDLTSQELSLLTAAIMKRRSGVPEDLFEQVAAVATTVNERYERALLGDQYDTVRAYIRAWAHSNGYGYDAEERFLADVKDKLVPTKLLPQESGKGETSSTTSSGTGPTLRAISSTEA